VTDRLRGGRMVGRRAIALLGALGAACAAPGLHTVSPPPQVQQAPAVEPPAAPRTPEPGPVRPTAPAPAASTPAPAAREAAAGPIVPGRPPAPRSGRQIVLNFDNADIEAVIQAASEIAGFNYTLGPGVGGKKVTVQTSGRIPEDEVFNVLLAVLEVNGVTAIRSGNLYKIVPITAVRERPVPTVVGAQPDPTRRDDEVITQIVPVTFVAPDRIAAALRPFVQGGNVLVQGNLLLVTDTAGNVARLLQIAAVLDVETTQDELRTLTVRYADATELARVLNDFFGGRRARGVSSTTPVVAAPPRPGAPPALPAVGGDTDRPPLVLADKRTNTLLVSGRRGDLELVARLVGQLDVDTQASKRVFIYYVENVKAKELAATLGEIFGKPGREADTAFRPDRRETPPGYGLPSVAPAAVPPGPITPVALDGEPGVVEGEVRVVADEPNNALIVTTFPRNWPLIEDTIRKLDRTPKQVLIEVLVAELRLNDENRMGLEWTLRNQREVNIGGQTYNVGSVARVDTGPPAPLPGQATPSTLPLPVLVPPAAGFSLFLFETDRFLSLLNLYANYGQLNVLSSPHILTSENKKAIINVSDSVPIVTQQVVSQTGTTTTQAQQAPTNVLTQSVEYRDAGIILTVTPRISDKRVVSLDVKQTVNQVGDPQPPSGSPVIIKREAETSVVLRDNQTLVLGGIIQTRNSSVQTGIPGLVKIPIIGFLFGTTAERMERTELLLVITPRVIGDPSEAADIYRSVVDQRPQLQRGLRNHPSILSTAPPPRPVRPAAPAPAAPAPPRSTGER
jgi:general secretion pathway protein D